MSCQRSAILVLLILTNVALDPVCREDQYYDVHAGMCEYCSIICQHAEIQGTVEKCGRNCPGYVTTKATKTSSTTASLSSPSLPSPSSSGWLPWQTSLVTLTSVVITGCVTALVVANRESVRRCIRRTRNTCNHGNHALYPVEGGTHGSEYTMVTEQERV
ncbi:uncharacterized protein LOC124259301 [Haliotis rubra]|uniref:uncharacterized protein LOC124259301 n=1 Tax=Haliotis rubra TaxID=36100 RepID=UPI001EE5967E|nr:uncharacterized protein LOC124259301 [Haliotis rubra]